ncbi:MAG: glutamate 5-kinase, partial [Veillonella parvula]|nr:glutamate 5-kinase [Veillonella parvula]
EKPRDLVLKQAAAAVGQGILIHMYERMFREYGRTVGQILLTKEDSTGRHSYLNLRNTLHTLLQLNVIPIINENDVVAIEEFKIGDNDTLSATVAGIVDADLLIILSDIEGLYTANPATNPDATLIETVSEINDETYAIAGGAGSNMGTGGEVEDSVRRVCKGEQIGTLFEAHDASLSGKHHWLAFGKRLKGSITIDDGCARAVLDKGASILPAGIIEVEGTFGPGDTISIYYNHKEIGRGLINYSIDDMKAIKGHNTNDIAEILGINTTYDEAVHRNNLVLLH